MSALVVDTSSWISYLRGGGSVDLIETAMAGAQVHTTGVIAGELLSGKLTPSKREELQEFLQMLPVCPSDLDHWFRVGQLRGTLAARGLSVSTPDAHIAQAALDLGGELLTEDAVFRDIARHTKLKLA